MFSNVSVQVCNSCGQVGYVPERCVQFLCVPAEDSTQLGSFSSTSPTGSTERAPSRGQQHVCFYSYAEYYCCCILYLDT